MAKAKTNTRGKRRVKMCIRDRLKTAKQVAELRDKKIEEIYG